VGWRGQAVNIETDVIGKYLQRSLALKGTHDFATIEEGIEEIARVASCWWSTTRIAENEGDLVMAADKVTPEGVNFMATHGRGLICMR